MSQSLPVPRLSFLDRNACQSNRSVRRRASRPLCFLLMTASASCFHPNCTYPRISITWLLLCRNRYVAQRRAMFSVHTSSGQVSIEFNLASLEGELCNALVAWGVVMRYILCWSYIPFYLKDPPLRSSLTCVRRVKPNSESAAWRPAERKTRVGTLP